MRVHFDRNVPKRLRQFLPITTCEQFARWAGKNLIMAIYLPLPNVRALP